VEKEFTIYGKALKSGMADVKANDLARLATENEAQAFQIKYLAAQHNLIASMNEGLSKMNKALTNYGKQHSDSRELLEDIQQALCWSSFKNRLDLMEKNVMSELKLSRQVDFKKRLTDNEKAQELFLELAEKVSQVSGPEVFNSMV
jgi:hypothetical protein